MDLIDSSVEKGRHKNNIEAFQTQTWDDFSMCCKGRQLLLYGAGAAIEVLADEYPWLDVSLIVDGDDKKQGKELEQIYPEVRFVNYSNAVITSPEELDRVKTEDSVILLIGTKAYEEIYDLCFSKGFQHIFSFLCMEEKLRRSENWQELDLDRKQEIAASWCTNYPIQKNKIVFQMFGTYSDHGKYITEEMLCSGHDQDIVWILNNIPEDLPEGIRAVSMWDWKSVIYEFETASCWVINTILPKHIIKRDGQTYIHTKHWASVTLKRFYLDAPTITKDSQVVDEWKDEFSRIDHMISGSDFDEESCRRGFSFNGEFIRAGSPRSDAMFLQEKYRSKVYSCYGISEETKTVLFAPTYRYNKDKVEERLCENRLLMLDYDRIREAFSRRFSGQWVILRRLHPSLINNSENEALPENTVDVTHYEDGEELCAACDVLISDYSSIMFEPAFTGKPVFLYAPDREDYIGKEYDLLIEYDSLPFPISTSNDELVRDIEEFEDEKYSTDVRSFLERYGVYEDGKASKRTAEAIYRIMDGSNG